MFPFSLNHLFIFVLFVFKPNYLTFIYFCVRTGFAKSSEVYKELGHYDYGLLDCTADSIQKYIITKFGHECLYAGEVEEGTDIPNGVGILVFDNGDTHNSDYKVYKRDIGRMVHGCLMGKGEVQTIATEICLLIFRSLKSNFSFYA